MAMLNFVLSQDADERINHMNKEYRSHDAIVIPLPVSDADDSTGRHFKAPTRLRSKVSNPPVYVASPGEQTRNIFRQKLINNPQASVVARDIIDQRFELPKQLPLIDVKRPANLTGDVVKGATVETLGW